MTTVYISLTKILLIKYLKRATILGKIFETNLPNQVKSTFYGKFSSCFSFNFELNRWNFCFGWSVRNSSLISSISEVSLNFLHIPAWICLLKVNNTNIRPRWEASFWWIYCELWTYFATFSSVSILNFENVIAG